MRSKCKRIVLQLDLDQVNVTLLAIPEMGRTGSRYGRFWPRLKDGYPKGGARANMNPGLPKVYHLIGGFGRSETIPVGVPVPKMLEPLT